MAAAMDLFPDGAHVRLRSRVLGTYLRADEDGVGVSLTPLRWSLRTAWRVHRIIRDGATCVLLYGSAYGRYLAATDERAPSGQGGQRVVQGDYDHPEAVAVVWKVDGAGDGDVLLRHISYRLLRANGRYRIRNNTAITVEHPVNRSTMMHWVVEAVPLRLEPPVLAAPISHQVQPGREQVQPGGGGFLGRFRRRRTVMPMPSRTMIQYVVADDLGNINELGWDVFPFDGRSVFVLRSEVAQRVGQPVALNITVCARAGRYGRLTPLVIDLPRSSRPMDIIALTSGSPPTQELQCPAFVH